MSWSLHHDDHVLAVEELPDRVAVLTVDGDEVGRATTGYWESATLRHGDDEVEVHWGPRNTVTKVELTGERFAPPPGSRAERRDRLALDHPVRFTMQRVGFAVVEVVLGVLGVGALIGVFVRGLLPNITWSWLPDVSMPQWIQDLEPPAWLKYVDPLYWIGRLDIPWPSIDLPVWLTGTTKYWLPIAIALVVAVGEVDRRRKRAEESEADQQ
ncbi:hypothetical protein [Aeromicrobium sp.]|uniref:hypothetical protein n=1 Tax=Aeromicrobium sp. TaxID=1871063 RepID=UPI003C39DFA2